MISPKDLHIRPFRSSHVARLTLPQDMLSGWPSRPYHVLQGVDGFAHRGNVLPHCDHDVARL